MMVSILFCVYKEGLDYIKSSLTSILNQTYTDLELVIIVDNPENIEAIVYIDELAKNDSRIKYFVNKNNIGLASSLNRALENATGSYIARMDADDIAKEDRIEKSIEFLKSNNCDLMGASYEKINSKGEVIPNTKTRGYSKEATQKILRFNNIVPHPTWFGKKEVFINLKGYRNINYAEDYDFLIRCSKQYNIAVTSEVLLYYRVNDEGISLSNYYKQLLVSRFLSKHNKNIEHYSVDYINEKGLDTIRQHAKDFIAKREAPAYIANDGK